MINRSATVNWFLPFVPFSIFFAVLLHLLFLSLQSKCHRPQLSHKSSVRQLMWITGVEFSWREHCSFSPVIWLEQANSALWSTATSTATSLFQKHPKSCSWFPFGGKPKIKHFAKKVCLWLEPFVSKPGLLAIQIPPAWSHAKDGSDFLFQVRLTAYVPLRCHQSGGLKMSHYHQHYSGGIIKSAVRVLWSCSEVTLHHGGVSQIIEQCRGFPPEDVHAQP